MMYGSFDDEQVEFLESIPYVRPRQILSSRQYEVKVVALAFVTTVASIFFLTSAHTTKSVKFITNAPDGSGSQKLNLSFEAANKYSEVYGRPGLQYPWIDDVNQIAEPYKVTTLTAFGGENLQNVSYKWIIGNQEYEGKTIDVIFIEAGSNFPLTLTAYDDFNDEIANIDGQLFVRYVKREIRQLDKEDRDSVMSAIETLYRVREKEGRYLYGNDYHDAGYFVRLHNTLAGTRDCDHMHDGMGFLNQHIALSIDFEKSIRLVDPSVTLPYWEYTIDAVEVDKVGNASPFYKSVIWSDELFGPFPDSGPEQQDNGVHEITTGRWAHIPVSQEFWAADESPVTNGYGLLRSPWNMNSAKYLTRSSLNYGFLFDSIPNCEDHYEQMKYKSFSDFGLQIQYKPHGSMHTAIGGSWGVDYYNVLGAYLPWNVVRDIALRGFGLQKDMWRKGLLECPSDCRKIGEPCACFCPLLTKWIADGAEDVVLRQLGVKQSWLESSPDLTLRTVLLQLLCNAHGETPAIGDSMCSAAPLDPTFWVLHSTSERLWQWARLNGLQFSWPETAYRHEPGYCDGHGLDDKLSWKNLFDNDSRFYSNRELYELLDPNRTDVVDYIYSDFNWVHCEDNYGIPELLID